jgi:hypothetical protein
LTKIEKKEVHKMAIEAGQGINQNQNIHSSRDASRSKETNPEETKFLKELTKISELINSELSENSTNELSAPLSVQISPQAKQNVPDQASENKSQVNRLGFKPQELDNLNL